MATQSSEQNLFSSGNTTATRERRIQPNLNRAIFYNTSEFRSIDMSITNITSDTTFPLTTMDCGKTMLLDMTNQTNVMTVSIPSARLCTAQRITLLTTIDCGATGKLALQFVNNEPVGGSMFQIEFEPDTCALTSSETAESQTLTGPANGSKIELISTGSKWVFHGLIATVEAASTAPTYAYL